MESFLLLALVVGALLLLWRALTTLLRLVGVAVSVLMALRTITVAAALPGLAGVDGITSLLSLLRPLL